MAGPASTGYMRRSFGLRLILDYATQNAFAGRRPLTKNSPWKRSPQVVGCASGNLAPSRCRRKSALELLGYGFLEFRKVTADNRKIEAA